MDTIGQINVKARNWLEQIPLEKWALSHDGGRRLGIMTTNMSEVFNGVLKGARNLPITALVQLTFYWVNSYFIVRREHGTSRLASGEEFTPHIDAKIKAKVVKAGSHEVVLYDHVERRFHVKTRHSVGSNMDTPLFPTRSDLKDTSVLTLQHQHRSSTIRVDPDMGHVLTCRHKFHQEWVLDDYVRPYIIQSRFYVFHRVGHVKRLHVGRPSRSLSYAPVLIDERFSPNALGSRWRVPLSYTDTPHYVLVTYKDEFDRHRSDQFGLIQGIHSTSYVDSDLHSIDRRGQPQFDWRLYHESYVALWEAEGDHIVTTEPIEPHMNYHAPYMTWYRRITRGHALEDFDSDAFCTGIVDIIRMGTDVMCIIREDFHIPHVEHEGGRSLAQSTVA
ncbi:Serine/threonine-protein phosphatase 7 long form-like [Vitis vinifera]|uniref:Serine/threonine-protein phosphatase 7 long form-like n=1 Tax=Vitis vinifera TaxID=29760 RepID=A0A438EMS7_VITVI|nr:Serine/threonine-protein phosphatase 7 long form-like [Vitis vinifera]